MEKLEIAVKLFCFLTEGGGNHPFARPWCLPNWSFPSSLMQIGWQVATLPVMLTLAILVVTPMARYRFILFYSFNPTKICVFLFFVLVPLTFSWTKTLCAFGHGSGSPPGSPCTAPRSPILKQFRLVSDPSVIARLFTGKVVQNPEMGRDFFQEGADAADGIL